MTVQKRYYEVRVFWEAFNEWNVIGSFNQKNKVNAVDFLELKRQQHPEITLSLVMCEEIIEETTVPV